MGPRILCTGCISAPIKPLCMHVQADAAVEQGKTLILFNPLLKDLPSASGVMGVR